MKRRLNLIIFRKKQNLTQNEMADKIKVARSTYCLIESGKNDGSLRFFMKIQETFNLSDEEMWALTKKEGE